MPNVAGLAPQCPLTPGTSAQYQRPVLVPAPASRPIAKLTAATVATQRLLFASTMCYYTFAAVQYRCGHSTPIRLERLVHACGNPDCRTSPHHPQPCDSCLTTCYTTLDVAESRVFAHADCECNPCQVRRAQQEGRTPGSSRRRRRRNQLRLRYPQRPDFNPHDPLV